MIKLKSDDILLFQGDSITHGGRGESQTDMNHIIGHGYQSILASRIGLENIDTCPAIINRGVSGDSSISIYNRRQADIFDIKPTVMSLLCGVNDANRHVPTSPEDFNETMRKLLTETKEKFPDIKLIIGEPFLFHLKNYRDEEQKASTEYLYEPTLKIAGYAREIAKDFDALFIPYWGELKKYVDICPDKHIIWDGVHPTYVGHAIMSEFWYKTVDESGWLR